MEDRYSQSEMDGVRLLTLFWAVTPRQRFVMYFFVQGWSIEGIARHLDIKERTVKAYMRQIRRKAEELGDSGKLEVEENCGYRTG